LHKLYKYETHLHTSEVSRCAVNTGAEMARAYKQAGFTGIFVTDHFVNGNCAVPSDLSWEQQMNLFVQGFENARAEGEKIGLDVFFAWEYGNPPTGEDYLTYNLDKEFLLAHPHLCSLSFEEYSELVGKNGGLIIHAHPYRIASYITIPPNPRADLIDGVEVNNTVSDSVRDQNHLAWELAREHPHLIRTSGTDIHSTDGIGLGGMAFPYRIESSSHFVEALRAGDGYLIIDGEVTDMEGRPI
jgi:hypothetical protein